MSHSVAKPDHDQPIGFVNGDFSKTVFASDRFQLYLDELEEKLNTNLIGGRLILESYSKAALPDPVPAGSMIYVTDDVGGAIQAVSDGTDWRRPDRAIVS